MGQTIEVVKVTSLCVVLDNGNLADEAEINPGCIVADYVQRESRGIVISTDDINCRVLWWNPPARFTWPPVRTLIDYRLIAQELINVQPMTLPSASLFYMDYQYGVGDSQSVEHANKPRKWRPRRIRLHVRDRTRDARVFPCRRRISRCRSISRQR